MEDLGGRAAGGGGETVLRGRLAAVLAVAIATIVSLLGNGYQFDRWYGDDQCWLTLIVDRLEPGLLANDPLVQLIGDHYRSGLFDLAVALASFIELPSAFFAIFLSARVLACAAMYRLALSFSESIPAAAIATLLFASAPVSSFGGIFFIEPTLTPRGLALPFALLGLDAFLRRRLLPMAVAVAVCLYLHLVSGLNLLGVIAFCGLLFPGASPGRGFAWVLAALAFAALAPFGLSGGMGENALRFDPEWAAIVAETVGPWVYLRLTAPFLVLTSLWLPVFAAFFIAVAGTAAQRTPFVRFTLAGAAALAVHFVGVDLLDVRPLLQASPQRATFALAAISLAAAGTWIARSLVHRDPMHRIFAAAFLLACLLFTDPGFAIMSGILLVLAWRLPVTLASPRWRAALAAGIIALVAASFAANLAAAFRWSPDRVAPRIASLRALGLDQAWVALQLHIREQSDVGDVVMAPPPLSPRVFARRPSALRLKMQSFTHVSRDFAFAFADWQREVGEALPDAGTREALRIAERVGASWLVLDDHLSPARPGDPPPEVRSGPYRAYRLAADGRTEAPRRRREQP